MLLAPDYFSLYSLFVRLSLLGLIFFLYLKPPLVVLVKMLC